MIVKPYTNRFIKQKQLTGHLTSNKLLINFSIILLTALGRLPERSVHNLRLS